MSDKVLASVSPSPARRWMAIGMLTLLGGMLVYLAVAVPPQTLVLQVFLLVLGAAALFLAERMRRATETCIELTRAGLRDGNGRVLCGMDQIASVERGPFAFKPSNGFAVVLKQRGPRAWEPGLWWRLGRRMGIGGVTPSAQGKFMADRIALVLSGDDHLLPDEDR